MVLFTGWNGHRESMLMLEVGKTGWDGLWDPQETLKKLRRDNTACSTPVLVRNLRFGLQKEQNREGL